MLAHAFFSCMHMSISLMLVFIFFFKLMYVCLWCMYGAFDRLHIIDTLILHEWLNVNFSYIFCHLIYLGTCYLEDGWCMLNDFMWLMDYSLWCMVVNGDVWVWSTMLMTMEYYVKKGVWKEHTNFSIFFFCNFWM